jgi:hypothetical protein
MSERDEVMRQWRSGEEKLYPVVTVRPDLYETCIGLVRSLADHLGSVPDVDALVTTYRVTDAQDEREAAGLGDTFVPPEVDLGLVRDAAYQVRARELSVREPQERNEQLIRRARAADAPTVSIWNEGEHEDWPPYRRIEMSLETGRAVAVSTELDPDTMTPRYVLEALQLDPDTGVATAGSEPLLPRQVFADREAFGAAVDRMRQTLLT